MSFKTVCSGFKEFVYASGPPPIRAVLPLLPLMSLMEKSHRLLMPVCDFFVDNLS